MYDYKLLKTAKQFGPKRLVQRESHKAVKIFTSFNDWEQVCKEINKKKQNLQDILHT